MATNSANLRKTLANLEAQYDHLNNLPADSATLTIEGIRESVIQRFEICYDTAWKTLKRYLAEQSAITEVPNSPKPVFLLADEYDLLAHSGKRWQQYAQMRIDTTHIYDAEKAAAALALIPDFLADAITLYERMTGEPWQQAI